MSKAPQSHSKDEEKYLFGLSACFHSHLRACTHTLNPVVFFVNLKQKSFHWVISWKRYELFQSVGAQQIFHRILWKSPSSGLNHHIWQKFTSADSKTHIQDMNIHHVTHAVFLSLWCVWLPAPGRHSRAAAEILPGFTVRPKQEIIFTSRETFQYKGVLFSFFFSFCFFYPALVKNLD